MKKGAIVVNVARGAVCDEAALALAAEKGDINLGIDVYTKEPFGTEHPFNKLLGLPNVCLTPHMAWGALDARNRCISEIAENIKSFKNKENRNRLV
jgi:glycerate dehydrogenase